MDTVVAVLGMQLLEHTRQVVAEVAAVSALREQRQATPSGRLRVSMPSDLANLLLVDSLTAFMALHPAISLELDLSPRRVDLLGEGFDVAIRMGDLPDGFAQSAVREGALRRVLPGWQLPSSTAWAVYPGRKPMPPKTRAMVDMLQMALSGCNR